MIDPVTLLTLYGALEIKAGLSNLIKSSGLVYFKSSIYTMPYI